MLKNYKSFELLEQYLSYLTVIENAVDYGVTFEPLVSLELCQLFRGSCATQFG